MPYPPSADTYNGAGVFASGTRARLTLVIITFCLWLGMLSSASAADPAWYKKGQTRTETMVQSLAAIAQSNLQDGFAAFESETVRGGREPLQVKVNVVKAERIFLFVTGCPDVRWGVGDWADAGFMDGSGRLSRLDESGEFRVLRGRCETNLTLRSGLYQKMRLGGRVFEHGMNVQADSVIEVPVPAGAVAFQATVGVDEWAGTNGTLRFSVVGERSAARKRLMEFLYRDFQTPADIQQIAWEKQDRIPELDWDGRDWSAQARRYSDAISVPSIAAAAKSLVSTVRDEAGLARVRDLYFESRAISAAHQRVDDFDFAGLHAAIQDLEKTFAGKYPAAYGQQLAKLEKTLKSASAKDFNRLSLVDLRRFAATEIELQQLKSSALLANPLLDFERLLVIKRKPIGDPRRIDWDGFGYGEFLGVPRQSSWNYGTMPNVDRWTNEVAVLSKPNSKGALSTFYRPDASMLVADVELNWDASSLMFSMPDKNRNWQICEVKADGSGFRQLTPSDHPDVHNYDPLYLPNGEILFLSTAPLQGVPCNAGVIVGMMYKMGPNGERIRQLTFEQDHDYTPTVLNNGRVLYLRWDYTDTPHVWNRLLMSMNPDGTGQMEYYGANSYWPNSIFFARPIPGHESKIVAIVTGHHEGRVGELFILDPAKGRHETDGVVQRMPRKGPPVQAKIEDKLTEHSWPKFLHPWPLNDKYFLVACKPEPTALWGIYLVDVFDNMVLVKEEPGFALLEPVPFLPRERPPVIQDRTQPNTRDALVYMEDVYSGPGLRGVPRGTVKNLRLFTYHFGYQRLAGIDHRVGADGPWEAKRVLGTVPVEEDGSALFTVPARTPISIQPLDSEGKAVALMRSWMTAMPGESVSCVGCHDRQSSAPPVNQRRLALMRAPSKITPWHGPVRGFSFIRDVQPVLDKYCVGCHDGKETGTQKSKPDLRRDQGSYVVYKGGQLDGLVVRDMPKAELLGKYGAVFEPSYVELRKFVRVGGLESDLHLLPPKEFHADTSELIQMLQKGHHNVRLDAEAWERLITWIDLNAPCHGRWSDITKIPGNQCDRRIALRKLYGGVVENGEDVVETDADYEIPKPIMPEVVPDSIAPKPLLKGWPMTEQQAQELQRSLGTVRREVDLGGVKMTFVQIPAGSFVIGDNSGPADERPEHIVQISKPFWMSECEVSNEQFGKFDPSHDSRFEHRSSWIFSEEYLGWPLNKPRQPVVRVSWNEATAFCKWLSAKLGASVDLPTESQWEYACRAGTDTPFFYGKAPTDFAPWANLGDVNLRKIADEGWRPKSPDLIPREDSVNDGMLVTAEVGHYRPNVWGLHDMHGNAAEWTRSAYSRYTVNGPEQVAAVGGQDKRVVRGGSWRDRPKLSRSSSRLVYPAYQKVYNVGFRVVME